MEHIGEILRRQTQINTSNKNMDTWSGAEETIPSSDCPICKGAGVVHPLLSSGKPDYHRVVTCRCVQKELDKEREARLRRHSGLELELLKNMTFDNFKKRVDLPPEVQENLEEAKRLAVDFAKSPDGWIVFQGVNGCGKTHLAAAIANYRLKEGKPVKFEVVPDLLDHLRFTFSPESTGTYDQLFEEVKNAPLLILDDLGVQSTTPWAQEKLYQVINYRCNALLPTVITTTCSTDELDPPISSRIVDPKISVLFHIVAPDYWSGRPAPRRITRSQKGRRG